MSKTKKILAHSFNILRIPVAVPLSIAVGLGVTKNIAQDIYELDDYSNGNTSQQVEYFNNQVEQLNTDYIDVQNNKLDIGMADADSIMDKRNLSAAHNNSVDLLENSITNFEYKLLTSGLSERNIKDIVLNYNGTEISEFEQIISPGNVDVLNDVISPKETTRHLSNADDQKEYLDKLEKDISEDISDKLSPLVILMLASMLATLFTTLKITSKINDSKTMKDLRQNKARRPKAKLSPQANKNNDPRSLN